MTHTMYWICVHFAIELLRIVCRRPGVRVLPKPVCDMSNSARPNVVLVAKKTGMYINRWGTVRRHVATCPNLNVRVGTRNSYKWPERHIRGHPGQRELCSLKHVFHRFSKIVKVTRANCMKMKFSVVEMPLFFRFKMSDKPKNNGYILLV